MSVWITILLSLLSKLVLPLVIEWLKKIFDRTADLAPADRRAVRKDLSKLLRSQIRRKRGKKGEWMLARDDDSLVVAELEAFYGKVAAKAVA